MDAPEHPKRNQQRSQVSDRTLRILQTILENPGRTTKQVLRLLADAGDRMSDQTLRNHLGVLSANGWTLQDGLGQYNPGPAVAGGASGLIRRFQTILECLRRAPAGLTPPELADELGIDLYRARSAIGIGIEFNCIVETAPGSGRYRIDADGLMLPAGTASDEDLSGIIKEYVTASGHDGALVRLSLDHGLVVSHFHPAPAGDSLLHSISADAAHATSGGHTVLARLDPYQRRRYLERHGMRSFTPRTPTTINELEDLLVSTPGHLYVAEGQFNEAGACLAILVHNGPRTDDPIALTTSVYRRDLRRDLPSLEVPLRKAATALLAVLDGPLPYAACGSPQVDAWSIALRSQEG
jgi:DNA-binding IclR family transcriptional regulator